MSDEGEPTTALCASPEGMVANPGQAHSPASVVGPSPMLVSEDSAQPPIPTSPEPHRSGAVLARREQTALAVVLVALLITTAAIWWQRGGTTQVEYSQRLRQPLPFVIDINACDWPELAQISGIGETLARRIIDYREERGGFRDPREILEVKGIGPKKLAELEPYLAPIQQGLPTSPP